MALYFPLTYQVNESIPFNNSMCNSELSLTPTTPSTINNQFFVPPPFEPFSYSHSPENHCQVSPLQLSPIHETSDSNSNHSKHSNEDNNYINYQSSFSFGCNDQQNHPQDDYYLNSMNPLNSFNSVVDTPDSVYGSANDNYFNNDNNFFKFEPEDIERFNSTQTSHILNMDNEILTGILVDRLPNTDVQ